MPADKRVSEEEKICEKCKGILGTPDHISLTLCCECPSFPILTDEERAEYEDDEYDDS